MKTTFIRALLLESQMYGHLAGLFLALASMGNIGDEAKRSCFEAAKAMHSGDSL